MPPLAVRAGCKVNLSLRITGVTERGYHTLDSIFFPLPEPHDLLRIQPAGRPGLALHCADPALDPADNTLTRAYAAYAEACAFAPALELLLEKNIPSGAGLGGGSSDAAALLGVLNALNPRPLDTARLCATALRVGADVPFFLRNAPCRVRGIGELCEPCAALPVAGLHLLLLCPTISISTAWAYAAWDALSHSNFLTKNEAEAKEMNFRPVRVFNDLEDAVFAAYPELAHLKRELFRQGAAAALMSGSGSSLFGLFRDRNTADAAAELFRKQGMRVYLHTLEQKIPLFAPGTTGVSPSR